jgi:hypothetical protein
LTLVQSGKRTTESCKLLLMDNPSKIGHAERTQRS